MRSHSTIAAVLIGVLATTSAFGENAPIAETEAEIQTALPVEAFFRSGEYEDPVVSPDGKNIAFRRQGRLFAGNPAAGFHNFWTISAGHRGLDLWWISATDVLMKTRVLQSGNTDFVAFRLDVASGTYKILERSVVDVHGRLHDALPFRPGEVVLARYEMNDDLLYAELYEIDVFGDVYWQTRPVHRLNKDNDLFVHQVSNSEGEFVLGISLVNDQQYVWQRNRRGDWKVTWTPPRGTSFTPLGISPDDRTVWGLSNAESDQVAAVAFDLETSAVPEVLFKHDRFDLVNILLAPDKSRPVAYAYFENGLVQYHFPEGEQGYYFEFLGNEFPDAHTFISSMSEDQSVALVSVSSPQDAGKFFLCDFEQQNCDLVGPRMPWLESIQLGRMHALSFVTDDDLEIDAFVTLPVASDGRVPLIVMPYGGPIGVSDFGYYSGHVQWLAYQGFAVLRVNYRGSGGYGKSFESAGLMEWGRGIEDDIMGALAHALESFPQLDQDRVCIYGGSYGGYSALISIIRHPEAFRCAASFAGVTDLTLLFNQSAARRNKRITAELVEMIGDPEVDQDLLMEYSPVYQHRQVQRPVFLSHGEKDTIVDVEHSWRLRKMLHLAGNDVEFHIYPRLGHGFRLTSDAKAHYDHLTAFFKRHLRAVAEGDDAP